MTTKRPHLTQHGFVERFHFTDGGGRDEGFCGVEWHPLADGRLLVIAYEHPDNPAQSITNAAEEIYQQFTALAGIDPRRVVWAESYSPEEPGQAPVFDRCTFSPEAGREPSWTRMTPADWRTLGVDPPAAPHFTRIKPHPEAVDDESPLPDNIGDYHPPPRPAGPRGEAVYRGIRAFNSAAGGVTANVTVTDAHGTRSLHPRLDLRRHSTLGFEWGYGGSGPSQLALALLADLTDDATAEQLYREFNSAVLARLAGDEWELSAADVRAVLARLGQPPSP